ncbi:hypothetical protein KO481_35660 [Nocardia sp. NEAU-G5]|uniref:Secreted protein n=1 Tax=Nocardia albiluteola TaxID=2842303 RepID=A0ABS6B968_9NOCA|nr:hypothetical protein [Nocardia albiluteola]MBU3066844.1 hypothetical protein [Nocardia albiluteola]
MSVSHESGTQRNPFGSRFLTCVAVAVAVSIGSAGLAAAQPGSGRGGGGGGGGGDSMHPGTSSFERSDNGTNHDGPSYSSLGNSGSADSGSEHSTPGYAFSDPALDAPPHVIPHYNQSQHPPGSSTLPHDGSQNNPPADSRPAPGQVIVPPPPGAGFTQWLGDGALLWIPGLVSPQPQPGGPNVAPNGNKGFCNASRPVCSTG